MSFGIVGARNYGKPYRSLRKKLQLAQKKDRSAGGSPAQTRKKLQPVQEKDRPGGEGSSARAHKEGMAVPLHRYCFIEG